jgi:hypothetical protein
MRKALTPDSILPYAASFFLISIEPESQHRSVNGSSVGNQLAATPPAFFRHPQLTHATL